MKTFRNPATLGLCVIMALAAGSASATNGYYTHGLGTKSKAQAGAGSANPEELLTIATNPAGLAVLPESIDAGLGFFLPIRNYKTTDSMANGGCFPGMGCAFTIGPNDIRSENEFFPIPFAAMNWHLSEVDHLAVAFFGRGGMNTRWVGGTASFDPDGAQGPSGPVTLDGTYGGGTAGVDLMQGFLNLTYARELSDTFSAGASAIIAIQRFEARGVRNFAPYTRTYVESFFTTGQPRQPKNLSGNGHEMSYGFGGTVGVRWQPVEMFSIAAAYETKMYMSEFSDYSDLFAEGGDFDMPATWTIGVALKPTDTLAFMFDVQEIEYSDIASVGNPIQNLFDCPIFNPSGNFQNCLGGNKGGGFGWEDMTVYKFGASWKYSDDWTWRAGYSFTDQPIPRDQMTFNILAPAVMEEHLTVGFSQQLPSGNEINLSFMVAPSNKIRGENNFDPSQDVVLEMTQYELELSYSWKR
jgi:long-chain fatty acid transport protein